MICIIGARQIDK